MQIAMLDAALEMIEDQGGDLVNKVVEVTLADDGGIEIEFYALPSED
ncbi:hypothetical protein [Mesorhizobium sp.]|nr:hypothetical protein [Mesorhizobium sp.]